MDFPSNYLKNSADNTVQIDKSKIAILGLSIR